MNTRYSKLILAFLLLILIVPLVVADEPPKAPPSTPKTQQERAAIIEKAIDTDSEQLRGEGKFPDIMVYLSGAPYTGWVKNANQRGPVRPEGVKSFFHVQDGKLHGPRIRWILNDRKEEYYIKGVLHGPYTVWYANGKKREEGQIKEGKPTGTWTYYNEDGTVDRTEAH